MIQFKTERIKSEFEDYRLDFRVKAIIFALAGWLEYTYQKNLILTCIYRSWEEQDAIYGKRVSFNPHGDWRAIDIRTINLLPSEIIAIENFLSHFIYTGDLKTYLNHDVGQGAHIHIQVDKDQYTTISKYTGED